MSKKKQNTSNPKISDKKISRRNFLKYTAAGTAVVAASSLTPPLISKLEIYANEPERPPVGSPDLTFLGDGGFRTSSATLNPQDYSIRNTTSDFNTLFSPVTIGAHTFSHRMLKSAAGSGTQLAGLGDEMLEYYLNMARGGLELIWIEPLIGQITPPLPPNSPPREEGSPMQYSPISEANEAFFRRLVEECGRYGCKLGMQLPISGPGPISPFPNVSEVPVDVIQNVHQVQSVEVARRLQDLGFVGIEINAAGFNMGRHFLSRFSNNRTDEYGPQTFENRARWVTECIERIKEACGDDFLVQVLMNCIEEMDLLTSNRGTAANPFVPAFNMVTVPRNDVMSVEEGVELARLFEAAGADAMHLRMASMDIHLAGQADLYYILGGIEGANGYGFQWDFDRHWQGMIRGNHGGMGMTLDVCRYYKERLNIPCGTVTFMDPVAAPEYFEQALADGSADFLLMKRPFDVDPEYVNKLREGRNDEILACMRCGHCHVGGGSLALWQVWYCRANAMLQRVHRENHINHRGHPTSYALPPSSQVKSVMVVGGGPAGMEVARVAAERGHNVTLYEAAGRLGGLMHFAELVKGPHENISRFVQWHERQLELKGVNVVTGHTVDQAFINEQAPDVLVVATGASYGTMPTPADGNDGSVPIIPYPDFIATNMGDTVLIWGSGALGFDAALWLTVRGKKVVIVTDRPDDQILVEQSWHAKRMMTSALYSKGLRVWTQASITQIANGNAYVMTGANTQTIIPCDTILDASQMVQNTSLMTGVNVAETYAIGDCYNPYNIAYAIHHGNDIGRTI